MDSITHFKQLSKIEVWQKIDKYSLSELAEKYNTNKTEIQKHVQKIFPKNHNRKIDEIVDGISVRFTEGAWMDSKERKYYNLKTIR